MLNAMVLFVLCLVSASPAKGRDKLHKQAQQAFDNAQYAKAADLSAKELAALEQFERGTTVEQDARERQVLSLFFAERKPEAKAAHAELVRAFPRFHFDPDRHGPDVVAFFEPEASAPKKEIRAAPSPQPPIVLKPAPHSQGAERHWQWYYLAPLGIGQYLAGSPIRGTVLLALELGFVAANIAGYALIQAQRQPDGGVRSVSAASNAQILMNVGFFGVIASAIAGIVDGAAFEP